MSSIPAPNYDAQIQILRRIVDGLVRSGKCSAEEADKWVEYGKEVWKQTIQNWDALVSEQAGGASVADLFAQQLAARQGTRIPDFEAFYRAREELDLKIFRPNQLPPESPP